MALDEKFFDSLNMELVKKKYYNAEKVNSLLADIRQRVGETNQENKLLKDQLGEMNSKKSEIGDLWLEAQGMSKEITGRANSKADKIVEAARKEAEEIIKCAQTRASEIMKKAAFEADDIVSRAKAEEREIMDRLSLLPDQQEHSVRCVEECMNKLKKFHLDAVDMLNDQWQLFLSGLYMPEAPEQDEDDFCGQEYKEPEKPVEFEEFAELEAVEEVPAPEDEAGPMPDESEDMFELPDLDAKLAAILAEMNAMDEERI